MPRKPGLGKGLEALIPSGQFNPPAESALPAAGVTHLPTVNITANPRQPRARIDPEELAELAASIQEHGIIQPIIVTQGSQPDRFILIAGERRLMAARQAGLPEVPAIVREASEQQLVELALVENVQRADLGPLEAAEAYRQLVEEFGLSHEEVASRVGKSRVAITNTLRLLKLPTSVKQALADGRLSEGHARVLLALPTPQAQSAALQTILKNDLNVRQTEELVRKLAGQKTITPSRPGPSAEITHLEERLRERLGTKVSLNPRGKSGGTLVIHYYSEEELNALMELILGTIES
jgi:ParB family transcriptional regulator, chromosome partitioning protein